MREEGFLNWEAAFPGIWTGLENAECRKGGFDAVIGNPPWDRAKLQEVEWFAARKPGIAREARAADRKRRVAALLERGGPLAKEYKRATERSETMVRVARQGGDYPLLSRGDTNLYSLFVERALALAKPNGMVGLLVPSGIGADQDSGLLLQERGDRRTTEGVLRLREPPAAVQDAPVLSRHRWTTKVLRLRCKPLTRRRGRPMRLLPSGCFENSKTRIGGSRLAQRLSPA